jgi:hypothetical protein
MLDKKELLADEKNLIPLDEAKDFKEKNKGRYPKAKAAKIVATLHKEKKDKQALEALRKEKGMEAITRQKVDMWLGEYMTNGGNGTKAVMSVFGIESRSTASKIATQLIKEVPNIYGDFLAEKGMGLMKLLQIAMEKAETDDDPRWWDRLMKLTGHMDIFTKEKPKESTNVVNIIQAEQGILARYKVNDELEGEYSEKEERDDGQ